MVHPFSLTHAHASCRRHLPFYATERGPNVAALRRILLTYAMYNFNLGYCQVKASGRFVFILL